MNLDFSIILPILIAFGISVVLSPIVIPFLKKLKFGQFVRDDGPETHLKKSGTPTMGGLIFLFGDHLVILYERLSGYSAGVICNTWFWIDWISR